MNVIVAVAVGGRGGGRGGGGGGGGAGWRAAAVARARARGRGHAWLLSKRPLALGERHNFATLQLKLRPFNKRGYEHAAKMVFGGGRRSC